MFSETITIINNSGKIIATVSLLVLVEDSSLQLES
jgi:hypothetical protein